MPKKPRSGSVGPVGFLWVPYDPSYHQSRRQWAWVTCHDSYSWWWRVLGLEINIMRED